LGPISSNVNEMVNVPTSTDSTPTDTVGSERPEPKINRVTGDPGERTAPKLNRGGTSERKPSVAEKYLNKKGMDITKLQGGLTNQEYNNLSSRDRNLLDRQLRISNQQGRIDTESNPNRTNTTTNSNTTNTTTNSNTTNTTTNSNTTNTEVNPEPKLDRVTGDPGERTAPKLNRGGDPIKTIKTESITRQRKVSASFDLKTGTPYINGKVVSFEEYNTYINLSKAEKVAKYGQ